MRKRFLSVMPPVTMAASLMTGCAGSSSGTVDTKAENAKTGDTKVDGEAEAKKKDTQTASGECVILTIVGGYVLGGPHSQYIYQYAEELMKENPGIRMETQAVASDDIYTKLTVMAISPDNLPTIFSTSADQVSTLYDLGLTEDLVNWMDEETIDGLANGIMDACTIDGQMTYYPVTIQSQAVIYRVDRSGEAGLKVSATWDEFVDYTRALTKDSDRDGQVDQWGFPMVGSNNSSGRSRFMSYLWSSGYELACREDGSDKWKTDIVTDSASVDVFSKRTDVSNVEGVAPIGIVEADCPTAANRFTMGYTNMFLIGPSALGVAYVNDPELKEKLGSFKLPGEYSGTMPGVEGYAIITKLTDTQKIAAVKYLELFTSHDKDMKFWKSSGKTPSTTEGQKVSYITGDSYAGFLEQAEDGCRSTSAFAGINGLKSTLGGTYVAVFSNEKTNGQAVEQLVQDPGQLLEDYN